MAKMECFLPYLIMIVILMFLVYDIFTILKRETFRIVLIDKESGCLLSTPDFAMEFMEVEGGSESNYIRFLLNQGIFPNYTHDGEEINGGLPQKGNLSLHLEKFKRDVESHNLQNYTGLISIIMSYWRHEWNLNSGELKIYQDESKALSAEIHKQLVDLQMTEQMNQMAQEMFEKSARNFLLKTIRQGKSLVPEAKWGLWGSPVCTNCHSCSLDNNSGSDWLFSTSDVAFPELEVHQGNKLDKISKCIESNSKIKSKYKIKVFLITTLTYYGKNVLISEDHLKDIFSQTKNLGYDGIIISTMDHPTDTEFCKDLNERLVNGTLGETIKELTSDWFWG